MDELDDWGLSAEQLDSLEQDAIKKISDRKASSSAASSSQDSFHHSVGAVSPSGLRAPNDSKDEIPRISVRLYLHYSGSIAAKFPYSPLLVKAFHKIPKASWHQNERVWIFPLSSLSMAEEVLSDVPGAVVEVQKLDPLVRRALVAASAVPDLQDLYDRMPSYIESKLLPFQRDGVRFVLQHGGKALLADEMGLGKTLQDRTMGGDASCLNRYLDQLPCGRCQNGARTRSESRVTVCMGAQIAPWRAVGPVLIHPVRRI